jgi:small subunit ribosomal protein S7
MSRKKRAPKKIFYPDSKYGSSVLAKFINFLMYDGKKTTAEKIIYSALDRIKEKTKEDPIKVFNDAVNNIRPNLEVRSRRVGGATYQVPVEVKMKRSQTLALRWLLEATRKRKNKSMSDKLINELMDAYQKKGSAIKKREDTHRMAESNKAFAHFRW